MLFWIFVIIGILGAGVRIWATAYTPKEIAEYKQLQEEYNRLDDECDRYGFADYRSEASRKAREARNAAYSKKQDYKEQHPNLDNKISRQETLRLVGIGVLISAAVIVGIMLVALAFIYIDAPAEYASKQAEYEVFSWEVENDVYAADDDVVGRKELYSDVRNWNKNIAHKKAKTNDFWVGIFIPDYYNDLQLIELN